MDAKRSQWVSRNITPHQDKFKILSSFRLIEIEINVLYQVQVNAGGQQLYITM